MKKYNQGFYNLMEEAGILSSISFDGYIKDVIGFGNSQALNLDGFDFEPRMQLEFDYNQLQVENRIKVMATYADKDSEVIPFGTKGFETSRGVIPRQKARFLMDEDDYRKYLIAVRAQAHHELPLPHSWRYRVSHNKLIALLRCQIIRTKKPLAWLSSGKETI